MLVKASTILRQKIFDIHLGGVVAYVDSILVDPEKLKIIAFELTSSIILRQPNRILDARDVREYASPVMIIDSIDNLVESADVQQIQKVISNRFNPFGLKVVTKKGTKLGKVLDLTVDTQTFEVLQLIVQRPMLKGFMDPELTIPRSEIVEISNSEIIVRDELKTIKQKNATTDFIPNFVNPFRKETPIPAEAAASEPSTTEES